MDADWAVEIGGGAPVIEALWPGFVDLRQQPHRVAEIGEAVDFPALAQFLMQLNSPSSLWWTSKCDLWEDPDAAEGCALGAYVDLLPGEEKCFAEWKAAEAVCRALSTALDGEAGEGSVEMIVRQAVVGERDGFAVTLYLSAAGADRAEATAAMAGLMESVATALLRHGPKR